MVISISRPYFAPFPGYFLKARFSDLFVILDQVQFPLRTTWITRNRFKNDQGVLWLTIPVWKRGRGLQSIENVRICHQGRWNRKCPASLKSAYADAPFFQDHFDFLKEIFAEKHERILDLNMKIIRYIFRYLDIGTTIVHQSELGVKERGDRLLVEICRRTGGSSLLIPDPVLKFLDTDLFDRSGIEPKPFSYHPRAYPQLWGDFIANLSIFDMIFNCGEKTREIMAAGGA